MFDYVRCSYELPNRPAWAKVFQTKDLDCELATYEITTNGYLVETGGIDGAASVPFTGGLRFYDGDDTKWVEYIAQFRRGVLIPPIEQAQPDGSLPTHQPKP